MSRLDMETMNAQYETHDRSEYLLMFEAPDPVHVLRQATNQLFFIECKLFERRLAPNAALGPAYMEEEEYRALRDVVRMAHPFAQSDSEDEELVSYAKVVVAAAQYLLPPDGPPEWAHTSVIRAIAEEFDLDGTEEENVQVNYPSEWRNPSFSRVINATKARLERVQAV